MEVFRTPERRWRLRMTDDIYIPMLEAIRFVRRVIGQAHRPIEIESAP
jgi:hypothetical protein